MQLRSIFLLLLVVSALCVIVNCQEDVDRRDVHRIILKPEKSKKHKKRTKAPKTKTFRPNQQVSSLEDGVYEPSAHASSTSYRKQRQRQRPQYDNHHDEYHDLIKPKPPRYEDATPYSYPEEETQYHETASSSNQQNYVPYLQNSDWNPIPSTQLTHDDYRPRDPEGAATNKRNKRKKKARRKPVTPTTTTRRPVVLFMTSTTTTGRPLTYHEHVPFHAPAVPQAQVMKPKSKAPLHQQHHYVNYNHNNKSHIRYEVSGSARPKGVAVPPPSNRYTTTPVVAPSVPPQPVYQTIHHNSDTKSSFSNVDNSYEVFERAKDYNKQIKQTSFKGTLVPQPVYPQLQPFLPTVSTYSLVAKTTKPAPTSGQLDFGRKQVPLGSNHPNLGFSKLYLGGLN